MFKRVLALCLAIILVLCVAGCTDHQSDEKSKDSASRVSSGNSSGNTDSTNSNNGTSSNIADKSKVSPILYKATDSNGNEVYLFGSIHIGQEEMYPLPQYVMNAYEASDVLAVECDIVAFEENQSDAQNLFMYFVYTDGTTIEDHIDSKLYSQAVEILEDNDYYGMAMDYYNAYLWSDIINALLSEKSRYDMDYGVDRFFIHKAYDDKKPIDEVESVEFQYKMTASFSEGLQELLLQSAVESYQLDNYDEQVKELLSAWCDGDEKELVSLARTDYNNILLTSEQKKLLKEYDNELIVKRNKTMTDYAEEVLKSGDTVFICVGAAHVVGSDGMAQQLKNRGYKVERVK